MVMLVYTNLNVYYVFMVEWYGYSTHVYSLFLFTGERDVAQR